LHIEDALERGKLRFFIGEFERGKGSSGTAYAFLDVEDARVILSDLADGKPVDFIDYKGGKSGDKIISRVLKIKTREQQVWLQVQNGQGVMQGGVIKPNGQAAADISIPLTMFEARTLGHACMAYLRVWEVGKYISPLSGTIPLSAQRENEESGTKEHEGDSNQ